MRPARSYIRYRRDLKSRAQSLRRDPTPPERKLRYQLLSTHPAKVTRQKPLGRYIAEFYCSQKRLVIELDGDTHFTHKGERYDLTRTQRLSLECIRILRFTNAEVMQQFESMRTHRRCARCRVMPGRLTDLFPGKSAADRSSLVRQAAPLRWGAADRYSYSLTRGAARTQGRR